MTSRSGAGVTIVDGAIERPGELRTYALRASYADVDVPRDGTYKRVAVQTAPGLSEAVQAAVGRPVETVGEAFRLNYGFELPNNWVHADVGYGDVAAVLYLSLPQHCYGGTAFWRHKDTGLDSLPAEGDPRRAEIITDWLRLGAWEKIRVARMAFNRLILYPTQKFHSRWPFPAFGHGPADGRLIAVGFYKWQ